MKDLDHNRIYITSQNHGYAIDKIPEKARVSHVSMNDGTIEGLKCDDLHIMTVQFHPEAWPGPTDCEYLFDEFLEVIKGAKKDVR